MRIGTFDTSEAVLVIAEIGNNHEGDFKVAQSLVEAAAESGAHAVKFQSFYTERFVGQADAARFERLKSFELTPEQFAELSELARSLGLLFLSTPLDLESAGYLDALVDAFKIASGDNNFTPLIARVLETDKPLILSTGASDLAQVKTAMKFVEAHWDRKRIRDAFALLHCVSSYPVPADQSNLLAIPGLAEACDVTVGYSDHTMGIDVAVTAVALGARIIEKHFTLDKNYSEFRDHQLSADPADMRELMARIKSVTAMMGEREKKIERCEADNVTALRRSIVAASDLPVGHTMEDTDLLWLRPGDGVPPGEEDRFLGKTLKRAVKFGEQLLTDDVE